MIRNISLRLTFSAFLFFFFFFFATKKALAVNYYISTSGNDNNSGTSTAQPWKTIAKVNNSAFKPGDVIAFKGGETFVGDMYFDAGDQGTAQQPVTIDSYGTGKATLKASSKNAIFIYNAAGFKIQNLTITGLGRDLTTPESSGINIYNELPNNQKLTYINLNNLTISGFNETGISVGGWNQLSGFQQVLIENVTVHTIRRNGISIYGQAKNANRDITVRKAKVFDVSGVAGHPKNTGSGIVFGQVDGGVIEYSIVYKTGFSCDAPEGPIGIWAYDSNNIKIQYNESHHNKTGGPADGGGFDFDGGVTNSVMQYNYSHDNDGAGFGLYQYSGAGEWKNNIVRYNISENDGRKNSYGGISLWKGGTNMRDAVIYNNTIYLSKSANGQASVVESKNPMENFKFYNNIFIAANGSKLLNIPYPDGITFTNNNYYSQNAAIALKWGSTTYSSLSQWQTSTNQEKLNGQTTGWSVDPQLTAVGTGVTLDDATKLTTLTSYRLTSTSPMINKGLNLKSLFNIDMGSRDFFATTLPQNNIYDLGAHEVTVTASTASPLPNPSPTHHPTPTPFPPPPTANPKPITPSPLPQQTCSLVGDTNCDNKVNTTDLLKILSSWGTNDPAADVNDSGFVDAADYLLVLTKWTG